MAWVLVAPRLRLARLWVAETLAEMIDRLKGVLLPYPRDVGCSVSYYVHGAIGWKELVRTVREAGMIGAESWAWIEEPLLRTLRELAKNSEFAVICYGSSTSEEKRRAAHLLSQLARVRVTGRIDLKEWRRVAGSGSPPVKRGFATVASSPGKGARVLRWSYPLPPGEQLAAGGVTEESVKRYVNYVFEYLLTSRNVDEAYLKWLEDQGWVKEELRRLKELAGKLGVLPRERYKRLS